VALFPSVAWAGGFEIPANGTEALSRGGAFTAKADDASALEHNIAGLARQRGTRLMLSGNVVLKDYEFTRTGVYPDAMTKDTPWGGTPYPTVRNNGPPFFGPFLGISTDFGILDRWTFAFGIYGPSSYGWPSYGSTVDGKPAPSRYDLTSANLLIVLPTLAAAVRVTRWLELGVALHLVVGHFELENASLVDLGVNLCASVEATTCDATTHISVAASLTATASLGVMLHPTRALSIGINVRPQIDLKSDAIISTPGPPANPLHDTGMTTGDAHGAAQFTSHLPWILKLGVRYAFLKPDGFEAGDIEVDGNYQSWAQAEGQGDTIHIDALGPFINDQTVLLAHHYRDTFGLAVGGSYNARLPVGVLSLRLGFFFDSAATHYADTRLDFDTMAKYAPTFGLGYRVRGVTINAAYAYMWSPDRDVTNGRLTALDGLFATPTDRVVNFGHFHASTQTFSIGMTINWDEALKKKRVLAYE
jgi:long-chain fatty acid transport protein